MQDNKPVISLVIPFYNAERFINECLASVMSQIESGCEVVLVDDGSDDSSADLVRRDFTEAIDKGQCVPISIANSGPGEARNVGVRAARGDYIGFLDSDDLLLPGYFKETLRTIEKYKPQIIQFHCTRFQTGHKKQALIPSHHTPQGLYELDDVRNDIFGAGKWFPWTRVFLKELLVQHPFPAERVFYEDLMTLPFIFMDNASIALLDKPLVAYRDNDAGTTRNHQIFHLGTLQEFYDRISRLPRTNAVNLLSVHVARTIVYFVNELKVDDYDMKSLIDSVGQIEAKGQLFVHLGRADRLFLNYTDLYIGLDKIRHAFRRMF